MARSRYERDGADLGATINSTAQNGAVNRYGQPAPQQATADPTMSAQEVQSVVNQNSQNQLNAAEAAALTLEPGLQINNLGSNGLGNWRSLVGSLGNVDPANANAFIAMNPGGYNSPYAPAMQSLMNQLLNPEQFRYDVNADGLYQQIKDSYTKAGKQAMMDTQGQSAALTGGYGNSYGAMAGQQAYQESLGNLAGMIPELQQLAYQQYLNNEDAKRNNLEALNKLDAQEYARYQDDIAAYMEMLKTVNANQLGSGDWRDPGVLSTNPMEKYGANLITVPGMAEQTNAGNINMQEWGAWEDLAKTNPGLMSQMVQHVLNGGTLTDVDMPTARAFAKKIQENVANGMKFTLANKDRTAEIFAKEEGRTENSLHNRIMNAAK